MNELIEIETALKAAVMSAGQLLGQANAKSADLINQVTNAGYYPDSEQVKADANRRLDDHLELVGVLCGYVKATTTVLDEVKGLRAERHRRRLLDDQEARLQAIRDRLGLSER